MKTEYANQESETLAAQLQANRPDMHPTPVAFRANLRARLLNHYTFPLARPIYHLLWIPITVFVATVAMAYVLFGSRLGVKPVSASELLQKANEASQPMGAMVYDRLLIDLHTDLVNQQNIIGEFWQSGEGDQFRFQLKSQDGELYYFAQRNGDQVWRSYHNQPVGAEAVPWIYQMTLEQYRLLNLSGLEDPLQTPVLGKTAGFGWLSLDQRLAERSQPCSNLFCLLGITGGVWQCANDRCTLLEDGKSTHEVVVSTREDLKNIYLLEIRTIPASDFKQVVQIDTQTYALVEVASYRNGELISRLRPVERRSLGIDELPSPDFFSTVPAGIMVSDFGSFRPTTPFDRIWVISVSPEPGINLTEQTELRVTLGYELITREEAMLQVMLWPAFPFPGGPTEESDQTVKAGIGVVHVTLSVEPEILQRGQWGLRAILGYVKETKELKFLAEMNWGEYQWCIRCEDKNSP